MRKAMMPKRFLQSRDREFMGWIKFKADQYEAWTGISPGTVYLGNMEMRELINHLSQEEREKLLNWPPEEVYVHGMRVVRVKLAKHLDVSWKGNRQWMNDAKRNGTFGRWEDDEDYE